MTAEKGSWVPVVFADQCAPCECCGEPFCAVCDQHYADCECPGPTQDDKYEYREFDGCMQARPTDSEET